MILLAFNIRQELNESKVNLYPIINTTHFVCLFVMAASMLITLPKTQFEEAISWLETQEERDRILRFKFEKDRRLALASQLLRRYVFVRYYGMTWNSLKFVQEQKGGKPKLLVCILFLFLGLFGRWWYLFHGQIKTQIHVKYKKYII